MCVIIKGSGRDDTTQRQLTVGNHRQCRIQRKIADTVTRENWVKMHWAIRNNTQRRLIETAPVTSTTAQQNHGTSVADSQHHHRHVITRLCSVTLFSEKHKTCRFSAHTSRRRVHSVLFLFSQQTAIFTRQIRTVTAVQRCKSSISWLNWPRTTLSTPWRAAQCILYHLNSFVKNIL